VPYSLIGLIEIIIFIKALVVLIVLSRSKKYASLDAECLV